MGDVIRCEGIGVVNIYDLIGRLSQPKPIVGEEKKIKKPKNPKNRFKCPHSDCTRTFCTQTALDNHIERHERTYECETCHKVFSEQAKVIFNWLNSETWTC